MLKWEVLPHLTYSLDTALSDYHLFQLMAHGRAKPHFHSYDDASKWVDSWLASKDVSFFQCGIQMLPERLEIVVASNEQYFQWHVSCEYLEIKHYFSWKISENLFKVLIKSRLINGCLDACLIIQLKKLIKKNCINKSINWKKINKLYFYFLHRIFSFLWKEGAVFCIDYFFTKFYPVNKQLK